ncbi:MAG: hypothetical protein Q9209_006645 [Squamulea sp. 1 TL-2023]
MAQRPWDEPVLVMVAEQVEGYDVFMMFINPQIPSAPDQLQTGHCVAALYRAIAAMTDGVIFCQLRSRLAIQDKAIGSMTITHIRNVPDIGTNVTVGAQSDLTSTHIPTTGKLSADGGTIRDPKNPHFSITFHFLGRSINQKEVSMVILEAMASAAPYAEDSECKELQALSHTEGAVIIIESVFSNRLRLTYGWATKTLKILYQRIIVPGRRWGDVWLEMKYDDVKFGELRMLRITGGAANRTDSTTVKW